MLASSKERVGVVIDQGALFRPSSEEKIRKQIVDKDWVECIILLPEKLFYNTPASGTIVIFNKKKPELYQGKVLFINAFEEYEKHPNVRRLNILSSKNIKKIVDANNKFEDVEGFARVVSLDEIRENNYNLNVSLYVSPLVKEEPIDLKKVYGRLQKTRSEREEVWRKVEEYIRGVLTF